jgi:hypothetical protein
MVNNKQIKQIASRLALSSKKAVMSLYNFLKTKIAHALFYIEKLDGNLMVRTNPLNFSEKRLDLILSKQNKHETKNESGKAYKKISGLSRACPERLEGILKLNRINKFGQYSLQDKQFITTNTIKLELDELFKAYISRIKNERIINRKAI